MITPGAGPTWHTGKGGEERGRQLEEEREERGKVGYEPGSAMEGVLFDSAGLVLVLGQQSKKEKRGQKGPGKKERKGKKEREERGFRNGKFSGRKEAAVESTKLAGLEEVCVGTSRPK